MRKRIELQQNLINHVVFVLDASASMQHLGSNVIEVADKLISTLRQRSDESKQETRVTMYVFGSDTQAACYDVDVLRTPTLRGLYEATGHSTALIDATIQSINELKQTATLYGDHSFLIYVLTDGEENSSNSPAWVLQDLTKNLPENWTLAGFVPSRSSQQQLVSYGFSPENTMIWDATSRAGLEQVSQVIQNSTQTYYGLRSQGVRGTRGLFQVNDANLDPQIVNKVLPVLTGFLTFKVNYDAPVREYVEYVTGKPYKMGSAYYQLTKTEEIQPQKNIVIRHKFSGQAHSGPDARRLIGLPDYTVKVSASYSSIYDIFVQSTSVNRKLIAGTDVIVLP